jgi:hypothetical protein
MLNNQKVVTVFGSGAVKKGALTYSPVDLVTLARACKPGDWFHVKCDAAFNGPSYYRVQRDA